MNKGKGNKIVTHKFVKQDYEPTKSSCMIKIKVEGKNLYNEHVVRKMPIKIEAGSK